MFLSVHKGFTFLSWPHSLAPLHICPGMNSAAFTHSSGFLPLGVLPVSSLSLIFRPPEVSSPSPKPLSDDWSCLCSVTSRPPPPPLSPRGRIRGLGALAGEEDRIWSCLTCWYLRRGNRHSTDSVIVTQAHKKWSNSLDIYFIQGDIHGQSAK